MKSGIYYFKCAKCGFEFTVGLPEADQKELAQKAGKGRKYKVIHFCNFEKERHAL